MLLQMPLLFAFLNMMTAAIELRGAPWILWITGSFEGKIIWYILPILMGVAMFVQMKMSPTSPDPAQAKMMMMTPVLVTILFLWYRSASGLTLYWLTGNVISIGQQWFIRNYWDVIQVSAGSRPGRACGRGCIRSLPQTTRSSRSRRRWDEAESALFGSPDPAPRALAAQFFKASSPLTHRQAVVGLLANHRAANSSTKSSLSSIKGTTFLYGRRRAGNQRSRKSADPQSHRLPDPGGGRRELRRPESSRCARSLTARWI